ncbi:MAG: ATP-dependent zinc protease family protein [bacterium]
MFKSLKSIALVSLVLAGCDTIPVQPSSELPSTEELPAETGGVQTIEVIDPAPAVCPEPAPLPVCPVCKACPKPPAKPAAPPKTSQQGLLIVGAVEKVHVDPADIVLNARIDTGAKSSSIDAQNITRFEREGERWVRFDVTTASGELVKMELPVERRVRINQPEGEVQRRYVVKMWLRLGTVREEVDVTLADRSELNFQLLVGRNFLLDTAVVDVSKKYTQK